MTDGEAGKAVSLVAEDCRDAECTVCRGREEAEEQ